MTAAFANVAVFAFLAVSLTLAGDLMLPERLRRVCMWARLSTGFSLGLGFVAIAFTTTAAAGVLSTRSVWAVQAAVTVAALTRVVILLRSRAHKPRPSSVPAPRLHWSDRLAIVALALMAAATFVAGLAPPSSMDAMVYHLRMPAVYLAHGGWMALPDVVQSYQPAYVEMAFGHGMALHGDVVGALLHWGLGIAAAGAAGAFARRLGASPWIASLLVLATPLFVWESTGAFIDLGLAAFGSLAIYWASAEEADDRSGVLVAGVLAGLAAGSKLTGGALAALAGVAAFVSVWPRWRLGLGRLVTVGAIALALTLPWYVHNIVLTGNPFYPVGNALFGVPARRFATESYGHGHTVLHLLASPFDLVWRGKVFDQGWSVGPALLALLPLGVYGARKNRRAQLALACVVGFWVFWFYSMQQTRLLLPILPLAAALGALGVLVATNGRSTSLRVAAFGMAGFSTAVGLAVALAFVRTYGPAALGLESRDAFLTRLSWHYPAFAAANARLPPGARVAVSGANNLYHLHRDSSIVEDASDLPDLRRRGFDHVLDIAPCDKAAPAGKTLWNGRYPLPASRIAGGVGATVCAHIQELR